VGWITPASVPRVFGRNETGIYGIIMRIKRKNGGKKIKRDFEHEKS
jgi:hypothetical protein